MRFSAALIPTLRDDPADAEVVSHKLMARAGMIRKVAAGIYTYLPVGWRVLRKVEQIVREEMERAGAQELRMPAVQPAELWRETGRWNVYGKELLRVTDRHDRQFCIGPTHEEVITDLVRGEVRSYKQLPVNLFQMQTKFRDEIRPRFGLMRGREFIMKDGYSFDADVAGAEKTYRAMADAYHRIFRRMGLTFRAVEADSGQIGGSFSHEFMVLADTGEDDVVYCEACDYAANSEKATSKVAAPERRDTPAMERRATPGVHSVADVAAFLNEKPERFIKALVFNTDPPHGTLELGRKGWPTQLVMVLIRGDREVNEVKLANHLGVAELRLAEDADIARATGGPVGFSGPVGLPEGARVVADRSVASLTDAVCGANAADTHLAHVLPGRDFGIEAVADLDTARAGDGCPRCEGGTLAIRRGIEVGHIFMLGTKYSEQMNATFLDAGGRKQPFVMGCYGIGVGRSAAAAVEQNHDARGIIWPMPIAPYHVALVAMNMKSEALAGAAETLYRQMADAGIEVLFDDRNERGGVKLTDAELLGIPLIVVLGERGLEKGICEVKERAGGDTREVPLEAVCAELKQRIRDALGG
ncbi:MAG: proline--tRNA ligase [Nitrospirae bacterium]|nr:proline--tRNA ligase [Nitrospirota bacterium]